MVSKNSYLEIDGIVNRYMDNYQLNEGKSYITIKHLENTHKKRLVEDELNRYGYSVSSPVGSSNIVVEI